MNGLARGDLALVVGTRSHWTLHAQLVLFTPLSTADVGGKASTGTTTGHHRHRHHHRHDRHRHDGTTPVSVPTSW